MRSASIYTGEAIRITDGITGKIGHFFTIDSIYNAVPIAEIRNPLSEIKKRGGNDSVLAAAIEEFYNDAGPLCTVSSLRKPTSRTPSTEGFPLDVCRKY
jgi:predicted nucleotidyltransferase